MTDVGYMAGDPCRRNGCNGTIQEMDRRGCSCHINPPCSSCTEPRAYCDNCGWDEAEEIRAEPVITLPPAPKGPKKLSIYRTTVSILQSGQPRPYADSVYHTLVTFEQQEEGGAWAPRLINETSIGGMLHSNPDVRYSSKTKADAAWHETYLERITMLDTQPAYPGSPSKSASKWEIKVIQPFLD